MSLDKAIEHGKEKRKQYIGAKAVDYSCRNHGTCSWCLSNRTIQQQREEESFQQALDEFNNRTIQN